MLFRFVLLLALLPYTFVAYANEPVEVSPEQLKQALAEVDSVENLLQLAGQLRDANELAKETLVWERLHALRPHVGAYWYELAAVYAQQDLKSETYNALLEMHASGFGFDPAIDSRFEKVHGTEVWTYIVESMARNREPMGDGRVAMTLPKQDLLIESLAFDPGRGALLVGSVREGKVYSVESDGKLKPLVSADEANGMWGVFGIAVDAQRDVLWVASTAVPHFRGYDAATDLGKAGIFKFKLSTGEFIKSFLSPVVSGQTFYMSHIGAAADGSVYAADAVNNALYQVREDSFRRILHAPNLSGIRALAVSEDSKILYFSDNERGLFGFDLAEGKPFDVRVPPRTTLFGIEGLSYWNGNLLAVQNGVPGGRILRLKLGANGRFIEQAQRISANQTELSLQVGATLNAENELLLIGNSQREAYDRFGLPRNKDRLEGARIFKIRADSAMPEAGKP
jgi:hypothetical protein